MSLPPLTAKICTPLRKPSIVGARPVATARDLTPVAEQPAPATAAVPPPAPVPRPASGEFVGFVHVLRGIASLLVVYCHLVGGEVIRFNAAWLPHDLFTKYFIAPLHITQNFGFFGVVLFFVISGFVIAHVAERESRRSFVVKRIFRIYPPLIAAILLIMALAYLNRGGALPGAPPVVPAWGDAILGMLLMDVIVPIPVGVLAVGWTLTIEIFFYAHATLLLPWIRTRPVRSAILLAGWGVLGPYVLLDLATRTGTIWIRQVAEMIHYLPLFAIGVFAHARFRDQLRGTGLILGALGCLTCYIVNLNWMKGWALQPEQLFPIQAAYATGLFFLFMHADAGKRVGRIAKWAGDISYSLYLVHVPIGLLAATFFFARFGITGAVIGGVASALLAATLLNRLVERPSQRWARAILKERAT